MILDETAKAIAYSTESLEVAEKLISLEPKKPQFQRDLFVSHYKLYTLYKTGKAKDIAIARMHLTSAYTILIKIRDAGTIKPDDVSFIKIIEKELRELKAQKG